MNSPPDVAASWLWLKGGSIMSASKRRSRAGRTVNRQIVIHLKSKHKRKSRLFVLSLIGVMLVATVSFFAASVKQPNSIKAATPMYAPDPAKPAKEYIYRGGKLVAIEQPQ